MKVGSGKKEIVPPVQLIRCVLRENKVAR